MSLSSRLLSAGMYLGVAIFGVFLGAVGTIQHRALVPWGALLGLALIAGFGVALRLLRPGRSLSLVGMVAVVVAQLALSAGSDGSLIVTAGPIGYGYTAGVGVIGAFVVSWPNLHQTARYDRTEFTASREDHP